jgi:hypothetical protein
MSIATLEQYLDQKNRWKAIFGEKPLSLLNAEHRQRIADMIDSDMSPENLTCDGEVRGTALRNKVRFLERVASELLSIDPTVTFYEMGV